MNDADLSVEWPLDTDVQTKFSVVNGQTLPDEESEINDINRDNVHAFAVAHVIQTFLIWDEISDEDKETRQEAAIKQFESLTNNKFPRFTYDIKLVQQPTFGHDEALGECALEGTNRALMLIRNFHDGQYARRWKPTYEVARSGDPFKAKDCTNNTPYWMTQLAAEAAKPKPIALPSRSFEGEWVAKGKDSQALKEHLETLEDDDIVVPENKLSQIPDPRDYEDGDRYRDALRTTLNCKKFSMRLNKVLLQYGTNEVRV